MIFRKVSVNIRHYEEDTSHTQAIANRNYLQLTQAGYHRCVPKMEVMFDFEELMDISAIVTLCTITTYSKLVDFWTANQRDHFSDHLLTWS